jgi:nitrate reductase beta subunit
MLKDRQTSDSVVETEHRRGRTNLLNWNGRGKPEGLFPESHPGEPEDRLPQSDPASPDSPEGDS